MKGPTIIHCQVFNMYDCSVLGQISLLCTYTFLFNPLLPHIYQVWQITFLNQHCDQVISREILKTNFLVLEKVSDTWSQNECMSRSQCTVVLSIFQYLSVLAFWKVPFCKNMSDSPAGNSITKVKKRKLIIQWFIADILENRLYSVSYCYTRQETICGKNL